MQNKAALHRLNQQIAKQEAEIEVTDNKIMKLETEVKGLLKKGQRKKAKHKVASVKRLK